MILPKVSFLLLVAALATALPRTPNSVRAVRKQAQRAVRKHAKGEAKALNPARSSALKAASDSSSAYFITYQYTSATCDADTAYLASSTVAQICEDMSVDGTSYSFQTICTSTEAGLAIYTGNGCKGDPAYFEKYTGSEHLGDCLTSYPNDDDFFDDTFEGDDDFFVDDSIDDDIMEDGGSIMYTCANSISDDFTDVPAIAYYIDDSCGTPYVTYYAKEMCSLSSNNQSMSVACADGKITTAIFNNHNCNGGAAHESYVKTDMCYNTDSTDDDFFHDDYYSDDFDDDADDFDDDDAGYNYYIGYQLESIYAACSADQLPSGNSANSRGVTLWSAPLLLALSLGMIQRL